MDPLLRAVWAAAAGTSPPAGRVLDGLVARYREPHRRYHGTRHLERVVADTAELCRQVPVPEPRPVVLAAFFHDAVYSPTSSTNETDSAALAASVLAELGLEPGEITEVVRLVLATAHHEPTDPRCDPGKAALLDADLAVLGAEVAAYEAYARGVRAEYAHLSDGAWRTGRTAVLRSFLALDRLYSTEQFAARERRARANLAAELATLERPVPH